jgi:hypothetical protein
MKEIGTEEKTSACSARNDRSGLGRLRKRSHRKRKNADQAELGVTRVALNRYCSGGDDFTGRVDGNDSCEMTRL